VQHRNYARSSCQHRHRNPSPTRRNPSPTRRILTASIRPRIALSDAEEWSKDHIARGLSFLSAHSKLTLRFAPTAAAISSYVRWLWFFNHSSASSKLTTSNACCVTSANLSSPRVARPLATPRTSKRRCCGASSVSSTDGSSAPPQTHAFSRIGSGGGSSCWARSKRLSRLRPRLTHQSWFAQRAGFQPRGSGSPQLQKLPLLKRLPPACMTYASVGTAIASLRKTQRVG